jgi:hypothetical protein
MIIKVGLTENSVRDAITKLELFKKKMLPEMISDLLKHCCQYVIAKASYYLSISDIGKNIVEDINNNWHYEITGNRARIVNTAKNAVFVEFGVGSIGATMPHENADEANYKYNVHDKLWWSFKVNDLDDVDMHEGYLYSLTQDGKYRISTKGSWRVMYAYEALMDLREDLQNPTGQIGRKWHRMLRYLD